MLLPFLLTMKKEEVGKSDRVKYCFPQNCRSGIRNVPSDWVSCARSNSTFESVLRTFLAGKDFRRIITQDSCKSLHRITRSQVASYHPAGPLTIDSAIRKLAAFVTELVNCGTDLRYIRPACEIQAMAGSKPAVRPVGISRCDNNRYRRRHWDFRPGNLSCSQKPAMKQQGQ